MWAGIEATNERQPPKSRGRSEIGRASATAPGIVHPKPGPVQPGGPPRKAEVGCTFGTIMSLACNRHGPLDDSRCDPGNRWSPRWQCPCSLASLARHGGRTSRSTFLMFAALWSYRGFVLANVRREFQSRYRVSLLGGLWSVLNPLAQIAVYTVVLAGVMEARLPGIDSSLGYSIYLCAGIITWGLFAEIVSRTTTVFVDNANLLKKLSFPRICLPAHVILSSILNFGIVFGLFLLFLVATGHFPGLPVLAVIPVLAIQILLGVGLGVLLGVTNVFFRDVAQVTGILMQFWFWLTPIVYPLSVVPEPFRTVIGGNPTTAIAKAYQDILLAGRWPDWESLLPAAVLAGLAVAAGMRTFRLRAGEMVDEL